MDDTALKGGISNTVYVWHSSGGCDACEELDGQEFQSIDEIPDRPHPNCNCHIEEREDNNDEECDCWDEIEELGEELEEIISEFYIAESEVETEINDIEIIADKADEAVVEMTTTLEILNEEYGKHLPDCEFNVDAEYCEIYAKREKLIMLIRDILSLLTPLQTLIGVIYDFVSNYIELLAVNVKGIDKYYHSRANCQSAQRGILGSAIATALSDLKEVYDSYTYVHTHKVSI